MIETSIAGMRAGRRGRPLVFSLTEAAVLVLVTLALIAAAAVPAMARHPHAAQAKTIAAGSVSLP